MNAYSSTKSFLNYPCSHRQWKHEGHCAFVHGYSRSFHFEFTASSLTAEGFVMDFGGLKAVKTYLDSMFDHTLLLNEDDPLLPMFIELQNMGACDLRTLPNIGMEGTSRHLFDWMNNFLKEQTSGRVKCVRVEVRENEKNSAIYRGEPS